jgi:hypothetical protein
LEELFEIKRRYYLRVLILAANVIFFFNTIAVIYRCLSASSLSHFFNLKIFLAYTITDTFKNCIMGVFITKFGASLYFKIKNYSEFYSKSTNQTPPRPTRRQSAQPSDEERMGNEESEDDGEEEDPSTRKRREMSEMTRHLLTASEKLKYLVGILNFCFVIRGVAVILWLTSDAPTENEFPRYFPSCASAYWIFFEIFPAVIPLVALAFTMGSPAKIWGGEFIDTNKTKQNEKKRFTSESIGSDLSNSEGMGGGGGAGEGAARSLAALKALSNPLLSHGLSQYDDDEGPVFNRMSRISGELMDVDFLEQPLGIAHSTTESCSWKEYSGNSSSRLSSSQLGT